jgi:predicted SAM-dependent methyltransferase
MTAPRLLNLGCGHVTPQRWINVDGSKRAWLASRLPLVNRTLVFLGVLPPTEFSNNVQYANLSRRFPWADESVDGIYMGEILEHFTREGGDHVLRECYRVLRKDGTIRIRVPDNARFWQNYLDDYYAVKKQPRAEWNLHHSRWVEKFFRDILVRRSLHSITHYHKWMYDEVSLILLLESTGFRDANRLEFHKSKLPDIENVEVRDELIVEAVK